VRARVLDARGGGGRVRSFVRVHLVVAHAPARVSNGSNNPRRRRRASSTRWTEEDRDRDEKGVENGVRLRRDDETRRTTRGERATTTTTRGRRRRRRDSRFDAFVVATTRGCIDAHVFVRAFKMHEIRFECIRWCSCRII